MSRMASVPPAALVLWAGALLCWIWLWRGARARARLFEQLSARYGGFVRSGFSWLTMTREPRELTFVRMAGRSPCRFRVRYVLPLPGGSRPATVIEFEVDESVFGAEPGLCGPRDVAGGRGLFLGGANLTADYAALLGELPAGLRPAVAWQGPTARLVIPALLGAGEEPWFTRALAFMEAAADRTAPPPPATR